MTDKQLNWFNAAPGLQASVVSCTKNELQLIRNDDMFECGKGIVVLYPNRGGAYIPASGAKNCGLNFFLEDAQKYCPQVPKYKLLQAYSKVMSGGNFKRVVIKL